MADIVYKVGDEVTITNVFANCDEWLCYVRSLPCRKKDGCMMLMTTTMIDRFGGKPAKITRCNELSDGSFEYALDVDSGIYKWTQYMFEDHYNATNIDTVGIEGLI